MKNLGKCYPLPSIVNPENYDSDPENILRSQYLENSLLLNHLQMALFNTLLIIYQTKPDMI